MKPRAVRATYMLLASVLAALLPASGVEAQTLVRGKLEDARTGAGVAAAVVELLGTAGERFGATLSDSLGAFTLPAPGPGTYQLRAVHAEYPPALSTRLTLDEDQQVVDFRLYMGIEGIELAPIEVIGRSTMKLSRGQDIFDANQRLGKGRFITAEEIRLKNPPATSYILRGEEGVAPSGMPDGTMVYTSTRTLCVHVVVNGQWRSTTPRIRFMRPRAIVAAHEAYIERIANPRTSDPFAGMGGWAISVDAVLMPEDIAGMEFYREDDENPEFWIQHAMDANEHQIAQDLRFSCGLLVMWTKGGW
ncbi:MAG: carboxypeptidase-like regulatory domain-containing protein [Gemmatimonadota bacterium]